MGCFSCFKSSTYVDPLEEEFDLALQVSRHDAHVQQVALAMEEEKKRTRVIEEERRRTKALEEEERRRTRMMEVDAQIANGFLYEDREDEQVKNDEQIAAVYQECLNNMVDSPPRRTEIKNISAIALLDEDKQLEKVIREEFSCEEEEERRRTKMIEEEERRRTRAIEEERRRTRAIEEERRRTRALEEERKRTKVIEEERRHTRMMEEDAQIANSFLYEDRERQINHNSALEDEQIANAIAKSLKEKGKRKLFEEQVKNDEQIAQDLQNHFSKMSYEESSGLHVNSVLEDKDEQQLPKTVLESLKEKGKRKQFEEQVKNDEQIAQDLQNHFSKMSYEDSAGLHDNSVLDDEDEQFVKAVAKSLKEKGKGKQLEKDEQVAVIGHESLKIVESPPRAPFDEDEQRIIWESLKGKSQITEFTDEVEENGNLLKENPPRSMCGGCNSEIEHGRSVNVLGVLWHPDCLWCDACHKSIAIHEVENHASNSRGKFHRSCYQRYCYVCKEKVKIRMFNQHHFWKESYCPAHDTDGTPKCCSCERLEPKGTNFVMLGDRRQLCLECMDSAVMDTDEVQPLHFEIREYFEGLNMKIEKEFPFLLVEKQALNEAEKEEKIDNHYELVTRGICLSEAQTVTSVSKGPRMLPNKQLTGMATESQRVVRECEVTAILILYGLPRLLTGYILAHEMMHAWLRLNGHRIVSNVVEEGICQVVGHMWLESQTYAAAIDEAASSSASTSRTPAAASESKKGECSDFEKKLVEFFKNQIEEDDSPIYGLGFKKVNKMVSSSSLSETLKEIIRRG